jgi:hypothetical protein
MLISEVQLDKVSPLKVTVNLIILIVIGCVKRFLLDVTRGEQLDKQHDNLITTKELEIG